jgi:hypothetical protein
LCTKREAAAAAERGEEIRMGKGGEKSSFQIGNGKKEATNGDKKTRKEKKNSAFVQKNKNRLCSTTCGGIIQGFYII